MRRPVVLALGALIAIGAGTAITSRSRDGTDRGSRIEALRAVAVPPEWERLTNEPTGGQPGVVFVAGRSSPAASVVIRRVGGRLAGDVDPADVAQKAEAALRDDTPGFEPIDRSVTRAEEVDVARLSWRERDAGGAVYRSTMLIVPTADESFYLTLRALEAEYTAVRDEGELLLQRLAETAVS